MFKRRPQHEQLNRLKLNASIVEEAFDGITNDPVRVHPESIRAILPHGTMFHHQEFPKPEVN